METKTEYIIVAADVLPDAYRKVLEAKRALERGEFSSVSEAVEKAGVSRSAFYKYRNLVHPFYETANRRTVTFMLTLADMPGILSNVLSSVAAHGSNILTINQTIPINHKANVTLTIRADENSDNEDLFSDIKKIQGVDDIALLAQE